MKQTKTLFTILLLTLNAFGGGGWVGNSPIELAKNYTPVKQQFAVNTSKENLKNKKGSDSPLMYGKGRKSIGIGFESTELFDREEEAVAYLPGHLSFGLSNKWNWNNLTQFRYLLSSKNNNEFALDFGLTNFGTAVDSYYLTPKLGLAHSWSRRNYSMVNNLSLKYVYWSDRSFKENIYLNASNFHHLRTNSWLSVYAGIDLNAFYGRKYGAHFSHYKLKTSIGASALLSKRHSLGLGISHLYSNLIEENPGSLSSEDKKGVDAHLGSNKILGAAYFSYTW